MSRLFRWPMRAAILLLLALAVADPSLPASGPRRRIYLIDVSASVAASPAAPDSFTADDARRLAAQDIRSLRADDRVAVVEFASKPAIRVPLTPASTAEIPAGAAGIDPGATDLASALETARTLAGGGDIVLFSDGRFTGTRPPVERLGVPVHVFPLGPLGGVDASIAAIEAPASASPGTRVRIRVTVESTGPWQGDLVTSAGQHPFVFTGAGRQDALFERTMEASDLRLDFQLTARDLCPANDTASTSIWADTTRPRLTLVGRLPEAERIFSGWTLTPALETADVVLVAGARADEVPDVGRLASLVRDQGAGLVMLGGPSSFALGGWAGTPVEDVLPFWAFPDERSALVFVLDRSGSMNQPAPGRSRPRIEEAAAAIRRSLAAMHDDDEAALVTFAESAVLHGPLVTGRERGKLAARLQGLSGSGSTRLSEGLKVARSAALASKSGRQRVVVVTDGKSVDELDGIRSAGALLKADGIGVTVVRIGEAATPALDALRETGAEEVDGSDFARLDATISETVARTRLLAAPPESPIAFDRALGGLIPPAAPAMANRATAKPGATILARSPSGPLAAFRPAGAGHAAATLLSFEEGWAGGLADWPDAANFLQRLVSSGQSPGARLAADVSLRFEDGKVAIAASMRSADRPDRLDVAVNGTAVALRRRGENAYSASLEGVQGDAVLRIAGRVAAVARRPHPPEFDRVGPDRAALEWIASATGGSRLTSPRDLAGVAPRGPSQPRSARPYLLAGALLLFLLEIAAALLPQR